MREIVTDEMAIAALTAWFGDPSWQYDADPAQHVSNMKRALSAVAQDIADAERARIAQDWESEAEKHLAEAERLEREGGYEQSSAATSAAIRMREWEQRAAIIRARKGLP